MTPQPGKPRVLIVDDKPANRTAFEAVLEQDYRVTTAESGEEAVSLCVKEEFAVIILDVRMPGMNGFETAETLRKIESTRSTPIIIFTSAYDQNLAQMTLGFGAGATDFLFSPVDPDLLKLKVKTYAGIFLRHEALRQQVQQLNKALAELRAELGRRGLAATEVRSRLDQVERTASEIDRQTQ